MVMVIWPPGCMPATTIGERLARAAFQGGTDDRGLIPCKAPSAGDAACRARYSRMVARREGSGGEERANDHVPMMGGISERTRAGTSGAIATHCR